jgi:hypothetical protein
MRTPFAALAALALVGAGRAAAEDWVARAATLRAGQGQAAFGAGVWLRSGPGGLGVGHIDLRYGLSDRVELRVLLPGLALAAVEEGEGRPALLLHAGLCELGFAENQGGVLAYSLGATITKRIHARVRWRALVELRHRAVGQENAELAGPGPLPAGLALLAYTEAAVQVAGPLALTAGLGFAAGLAEGRSFGYGALGIVGSATDRLDFTAQLVLEQGRNGRPVDPALFGGTAIRF